MKIFKDWINQSIDSLAAAFKSPRQEEPIEEECVVLPTIIMPPMIIPGSPAHVPETLGGPLNFQIPPIILEQPSIPLDYMTQFWNLQFNLPNFEEETRNLAYFKWEAAGRPEGDGHEFWLAAEAEINAPLEDLMLQS
jgi:hypothetical protein